MAYCKDCDTAASSLVPAVDSGNQRENYEAVIRELNARGGILGRRVVPAFYGFSVNDNVNVTAQAACAFWTQDRKVFAGFFFWNPVMQECMNKAGAVLLGSGYSASPQKTFARYPAYVEVSSLNVDRMATATAEGLARGGYFGRGATVGVVAYDDVTYKEAVANRLRPALSRRGINVKVTSFVHSPQSQGELSQTSNEVSNTVLRMRTEGVDHVILLDGVSGVAGNGILTVLFMNNAETQQFRPRYGLESGSTLSGLNGIVPEQQLANALAIGWLPLDDLTAADDPDSKANDARRRCIAVMAASQIRAKTRGAAFVQLQACDYFWFLRQAAAQAGPVPLTRASFMASVNRLGTSYQSPLTHSVRFGPDRHDGASIARLARHEGSCACFRYFGAPLELP